MLKWILENQSKTLLIEGISLDLLEALLASHLKRRFEEEQSDFFLTLVVLQLSFWLLPLQVSVSQYTPGYGYRATSFVVYYSGIPEVLRKHNFLGSKKPLIERSKRGDITKRKVGLSDRKIKIDLYVSLLAMFVGVLLGVLISWRKMLARFTRSAKGVVRNIDDKLDELNK